MAGASPGAAMPAGRASGVLDPGAEEGAGAPSDSSVSGASSALLFSLAACSVARGSALSCTGLCKCAPQHAGEHRHEMQQLLLEFEQVPCQHAGRTSLPTATWQETPSLSYQTQGQLEGKHLRHPPANVHYV